MITSVDTTTATAAAPADVSSILGAFTDATMVEAAAGLFVGHRVPERRVGVPLLHAAPVATPSYRKAIELGFIAEPRLDHELVEGPRSYVFVSPGSVQVKRSDPVRADRTRERLIAAEQIKVDADGIPITGWWTENPEPAATRARITSWSRKSRTNMLRVLGSLDYTPLLGGGRPPVMVTLTYPGEWERVVPDAAAAQAHLRALRWRYQRATGTPMVGVWKREFQRRGAPHFHLLVNPPTAVKGQPFAVWLSRTWASIVDAERCDECTGGQCCEYARHRVAGTGVDLVAGAQCTDPKRVGVYFMKHGVFAEKDYQNDAPDAWVESGSVGRFWGLWGLSKAVSGVEVTADDATATARTLRRWDRAKGRFGVRPGWRSRTHVDLSTGEVVTRWRRVHKRQRVWYVQGDAGFVLTGNGPALASGVARYLDTRRDPAPTRKSGAGPRGYLP